MWLKPASDVTYRSRRRAASVPADHGVRISRYDVGSGAGANKASVIANYAHEDTDAIASASKRNDREFLYEVSTKMANLAANANQPLRRSSSRDRSPSVRRPPPPPVSSSTLTPVSNYLRHAASLTPEDNYDIAAYLDRSPSSSHGSYKYGVPRATSLPPVNRVHAPLPSVPRWFPSSVAYYGRPATHGLASARGGSQIPLPVGLPPRPPSSDRMNAITDSVVGVAHTSLYGDIVIGIPYKKRYMYNVQRDVDDLDTQSLPAIHLPVHTRASIAPHFGNTRPASLALPSGTPELTQPYSRASYAGPANGGVSYGYRPVAHRVGGSANHLTGRLYPGVSSSLATADLDDAISIKSYPGAYVGGRSTARTAHRPLINHKVSAINDFENDVDLLDFDDSGAVSQLSSLKKDARSILSRYAMPPPAVTSNGPKHLTANELDQKYGRVLSSMQAQNRLPPRSDYETSALPPYPSKPKKPPMSDTRRNIRNLLCRTRNDPHYFDD